MYPDLMILVVLALYWASYFVLHSVLASLAFKNWFARRFPAWLARYRLLYNMLSVVLLIPAGFLMFRFDAEPLWRWEGLLLWLSNGLALAAVLAFVASLRSYEMEGFSGLRGWNRGQGDPRDKGGLRISYWHRFVRHPWYFFALVILWTRDMNAAQFLSYSMMSVYFVIGSRLEEQKLCVFHGEAYREFQQRVPALCPLPWRYLSEEDARRIERRAQSEELSLRSN